MEKKTITRKSTKVKRSVRFTPDTGTFAVMAFQGDEMPKIIWGLVINESYSGFAAVVMLDKEIASGTECMSRVGHLPDTIATVRWCKKLEKNLFKMGLEYNLE